MPAWESLHGLIDDERCTETLKLFTFQASHAIVWRDVINDWFHRISGIDDAQGRVGHHPGRIEPEAMTASGYTPVDITPWETASGGKAVVCKVAAAVPLSPTLDKPAGTYDIAVQYFRPPHRRLALRAPPQRQAGSLLGRR